MMTLRKKRIYIRLNLSTTVQPHPSWATSCLFPYSIVSHLVSIQSGSSARLLHDTSFHQLIDQVEDHQITAVRCEEIHRDRQIFLLQGNGGVVQRLAD